MVLLVSQQLDSEGLSNAGSFTLGTITTYLALSQTVTAFMHEYLVEVKLAVGAMHPDIAQSIQGPLEFDVLGAPALFLMLVMAGGIRILMTYVAPLTTALRSPVRGRRRWFFAGYYFAIQIPIFWVHATALHFESQLAGQPADLWKLFALQFMQPLLWFR